jgi:hypothetical protein
VSDMSVGEMAAEIATHVDCCDAYGRCTRCDEPWPCLVRRLADREEERVALLTYQRDNARRGRDEHLDRAIALNTALTRSEEALAVAEQRAERAEHEAARLREALRLTVRRDQITERLYRCGGHAEEASALYQEMARLEREFRTARDEALGATTAPEAERAGPPREGA